MTPYHHFRPGQEFEICGQQFRIRPGVKEPGDMVLEYLAVTGKWRAVQMEMVGFMTNFLYHNEEIIYPLTKGFKGGKKFMFYLNKCVRNGWQDATRELKSEIKNKRCLEQRGLWSDEEAAQ